jgi:hypothetical protein
MEEEAGSENQILRLCMKQLSLNWAVLFSSLNHLSMVARALSIQAQGRLQPVLEEVELFTVLVPRANISEVNMARTPYVTVRGDVPTPPPPPPTPKETPMPEVAETVAVYLADADRVEKLLDIITNTVDFPNVPCIRQAAQNELAQIEADLRAQLYPELVAAEQAALKAAQEAEEARVKQREEEKAEAKAKENGRKPAEQSSYAQERRV